VDGAILFAIVAIFIVNSCALSSVILVNNFHLSAVYFSIMESWKRPVALQPPHNATVITSKAKETCVVIIEEARCSCVGVIWGRSMHDLTTFAAAYGCFTTTNNTDSTIVPRKTFY